MSCEHAHPRVELTVDTELVRGRVYAVRIPDGLDVADLTDELRRVIESTGAGIVAFWPGCTITEIEAEAVRMLHLEVERLRRQVAALTEQHDQALADLEDYRVELLDRSEACGRLADQRADRAREIEETRAVLGEARAVAEQIRAELTDRTEACARLADTRAELQRALTEALDGWTDEARTCRCNCTGPMPGKPCICQFDEIEQIRREAGLA